MKELIKLIQDNPEIWARTDEDRVTFISICEDEGLITPQEAAVYMWQITGKGEMPPLPPEEMPLITPELPQEVRERVEAATFEKEKNWYKARQEGWREVLKERLKEDMPLLWEEFTQPAKETLGKVWDAVAPELNNFGDKIFKKTLTILLGGGVVTPEMAPGLAGQMFGFALGAGIAAHAASVASEILYPTKTLGINQAIGMIAELGSFGPIAAATLGQVHYSALRRPMGYYVDSITRSRLPDEFMLQQMVFEGVLSEAEFKNTLKYYGYSDKWIERYWPTMFGDPRYFELSMMIEDQMASDAWIKNRVKELGYEPDVNEVMEKGLIKKAIRTQRQDYYKQAFNLFKEGMVPREYFNKVLDELEFRPEARAFAVKSAELAYLYDVTTDEIKYWTDSYLKDLVTDDDLALRLSLLGLNRWRVNLHVRLAHVRKYKRPAAEDPAELEKVMSQARAKYSQAYVELYRKGYIESDTLYGYLVELGIAEELAEATRFLEETRKLK